MSQINNLVSYSLILNEEKKWSGKVKTDWSPPKDLFAEGSVEKIAKTLKRESSDYQEAMQRLVFYINRAGDNLSSDRKTILNDVKNKLRKLYGRSD